MNAMWSGYIDTPPTQAWHLPHDMTNLLTWLAPAKPRRASAQLWILGGGPNDQIQEIKDHEKPK